MPSDKDPRGAKGITQKGPKNVQGTTKKRVDPSKHTARAQTAARPLSEESFEKGLAKLSRKKDKPTIGGDAPEKPAKP